MLKSRQWENRITLNYPSGTSIAYTYDADNCVSMILNGANARAVYNYVGPSRRSQVALLNGASTVSTYKLQYDGVANITSALYYDPTGANTLIGFEYAYDKMHNPQYEIRTHQSNYGDAYYYDNLYRVTRVIYNDSNPASPVRKEMLSKAAPLLAEGGYIPLADGRVRANVPFENYVYYRRLLEKGTQA